MGSSQVPGNILLSPQVLITFIVCSLLAGFIIWLLSLKNRRQRDVALAEQRRQQEAAIERLLNSTAQSNDELVAQYEEQLRERDDRIADLENQIARLRDRLTSSGFMGLFGSKQRHVISALLLENEQLHELLTRKQLDLHELMVDMTSRLTDRIAEQAEENARAIRYKQALLSAFLQQDEARRLFDTMISDGRLPSETGPTDKLIDK